MPVLCQIVVDDEQTPFETSFDVLPRVGEFVDIGAPDDRACRVTRVLHKADGELGRAHIRLDATRQML